MGSPLRDIAVLAFIAPKLLGVLGLALGVQIIITSVNGLVSQNLNQRKEQAQTRLRDHKNFERCATFHQSGTETIEFVEREIALTHIALVRKEYSAKMDEFSVHIPLCYFGAMDFEERMELASAICAYGYLKKSPDKTVLQFFEDNLIAFVDFIVVFPEEMERFGDSRYHGSYSNQSHWFFAFDEQKRTVTTGARSGNEIPEFKKHLDSLCYRSLTSTINTIDPALKFNADEQSQWFRGKAFEELRGIFQGYANNGLINGDWKPETVDNKPVLNAIWYSQLSLSEQQQFACFLLAYRNSACKCTSNSLELDFSPITPALMFGGTLRISNDEGYLSY